MRSLKKNINTILDNRLRMTFIQLISDLNNPKEIESFFGDFLTPGEYEIFTKRLAIAYWLKKGRNYTNIKNNLKVSSAAISSVQSIMKKEGIKLALKKIEAEEWASLWEKKIKKFTKGVKI